MEARSGAAAALLWLLLVWRWFDVGATRPRWLEAVPPLALAASAVVVLWPWLRARWPQFRAPRPAFLSPGDCRLPVALAVLFRLPFVVQGAAGAVTPDGALSGIVMLRLLQGAEHLVFVPSVPYSGSLKSHLAALLAAIVDDPARAFALASVLFYAGFVAAVVRLAALLPGASRTTVLGSGLYAAFAPPFVTRYSLSNDGNYVEVLALGTWALLLVVRGVQSPSPRPLLLGAGLLLGLAFWSHILAVIPLAACALVVIAFRRRACVRALLALLAGWTLGNAPGLFWNLANGGESFRYLFPGGPNVGGEQAGPGLPERLLGQVADHLPMLLGRDVGYGPGLDAALRLVGGLAACLLLVALARAVRQLAREPDPSLGAALALLVVNLAVALFALPYIPGNPRYLLPLAGPAAVLLPWAFARGGATRVVLSLLVGAGAAASVAQLPGTVRADARWRGFVSDLEDAGVRRCYTDFYLATKINFLSAERIICSASLGPTTTDYFLEYRALVDAAPRAALVSVNSTAARKLEDRLRDRGVPFERRDFMKPVLIPQGKVGPDVLFPERDVSGR